MDQNLFTNKQSFYASKGVPNAKHWGVVYDVQI